MGVRNMNEIKRYIATSETAQEGKDGRKGPEREYMSVFSLRFSGFNCRCIDFQMEEDGERGWKERRLWSLPAGAHRAAEDDWKNGEEHRGQMTDSLP